MGRTGCIAERGPQHAYTAGEDPFADSPARPDPLDETLPGNDFTGFFDQHDQHVHHFRLQMHGTAIDDQAILVWTDLSVPQPDRFQLDLKVNDVDNSRCIATDSNVLVPYFCALIPSNLANDETGQTATGDPTQ